MAHSGAAAGVESALGVKQDPRSERRHRGQPLPAAAAARATAGGGLGATHCAVLRWLWTGCACVWARCAATRWRLPSSSPGAARVHAAQCCPSAAPQAPPLRLIRSSLATPAGCCRNFGGSATVRVMRHESNRACLRARACTKRARALCALGRIAVCAHACVLACAATWSFPRLSGSSPRPTRGYGATSACCFVLMRWLASRPVSCPCRDTEIPPALRCPRGGLLCRSFGFLHALRRLPHRSNRPSLVPNEGAHE